MDRLILYLGGIALLLALAGIRELIPERGQQVTDAVQPATEGGNGEPVTPREPADATHRGMVLGIFPWRDDRPRFQEEFAEMHALGINAVSFNFNWYMDTIYESTVYRGVADSRNQTASDIVIGQAIADAHAAGLHVMLFPTIYILHLGEGEWRGRIRPPDWEMWFASYRALVVSLARLAERFSADYLCVGVELISSEVHGTQWKRIVTETRDVFSGKLLYSTNWDARENRAWFRDLDMIAMNAYYELTDKRDASIDELIDAWHSIREEIHPWRAKLGLPLIISEIGYRSADGSVTKPWNYFLPGDVDTEEQRRAYEAFFRAWYDDEMLQGVYFYNWFGKGGPDDKNYTPRGKPAADVMKDWYGRIAARDIRRAEERRVRPTLPPGENTPAENAPAGNEPDIGPDIGPRLPPDWAHGSPGTDSMEPRGLPTSLMPTVFRTSPTLAVQFRDREGWFDTGSRLQATFGDDGGTRDWEIVLIDPVDRLVIVRDAAHRQTLTLRGER